MTNRRQALKAALASGGLLAAGRVCAAERQGTPSSRRLRLAVVGVGGRGADNLAGVGHEDIVALCDVDAGRLAKAAAGFPQAKTYADFREALAAHPDVDGVVVSTPDHTHAVAAAAALRLGKHVYCEKPLCKDVADVRTLTSLAAEKGVRTQMGTQIHSGDNYRRVVEHVRGGALGAIKEAHVYFAGRPASFAKKTMRPPPQSLRYDLWLGPVADTPYVVEQSHFNWRYWWEFGNGTLGDFGCHYMDLAFWALELGQPTSVEATGAKDHDGVNDMPARQKVAYEFPARGQWPALTLTWWHGGGRPEQAQAFPQMRNAVLFVGERGMLAADYGSLKFSSPELAAASKPPRLYEPSIGHHREWLHAIRTGKPSLCDFAYSGPLTETVLLGTAAYRGALGRKLAWDAGKLAFADAPAANALLRHEPRAGWTV